MSRLLKGLSRRTPSPSFKYIFSYIIVATVPLIIISFFSYQFFIEEYRAEVLQNRASSLSMTRNSFEMILTQMENLVKQIETEDDLLQYDMEDGMMTTLKLHNRLAKYQRANGYLRDILFYRHGSGYICAASSTYRLDNYVGGVNRMSGVTPQQFSELMNHSTGRYVLLQTEKLLGVSPVETVSFLYSMPYNDVSPYAAVVFSIEAAQIRAFLGSGESGEEYAIIIESDGGPVFISSSGDTEQTRGVFTRVAAQGPDQGSFADQVEGDSYMVSYLRDPLKGVTYLCRTPEHLALTKVTGIRNLFLLLTLLLTAVEFGVVFCVSYINYRPIRSLRQYLSDNFDELQDEEGEIQAARRILADMLLTHERMSEKLSLSTDTLREVILYKLINGGFSSREELSHAAGEAGILLSKPFLRVAIFQGDDEAHSAETTELLALFCQCLGDEPEIYCCSFPPRVVFVLASDLSVEREFRRGFDRLQDRLAETAAPYCIGVGGVQQDISRLHLSYIQAAAALDYRFVSGSNHAVFYTDILSDREIFDSYPQEEIAQLRESIIAGNAERFSYLMDEILSLLRRRDSNLILAKLVSYDALNTVIKALLEVSKGYTDISAHSPDITLLASMHAIGELTAALESMRDRAVGLLGAERADNPFIGQVLAVIDENLENYSFTVRELAERFHISQNNLSQRFKRAMNMTPIEYINRQKIERAKLYLSGTDLPLRAIVERLGYSNDSSFIRKFKATTGLTPGEYRKKMNLHKE